MEAIVRLSNFHSSCGARIFTSYDEAGEKRYHASDRANAGHIAKCPACGGELVRLIPVIGDYARTEGQLHTHLRAESLVITAHAMEQRWLAARERLCAGEPLDAEALVCMSAELEEGRTLEELAPLYGRDHDGLREEIATFTITEEPNTTPTHTP